MRKSRVPRSTTDALRQFARRNQLTLNTIVQGAWALLLSRYSGEDDVVFGATVSGRPAELPGIESMVGLFINTLPVRVSVPPDAALCPGFVNSRRISLNRADSSTHRSCGFIPGVMCLARHRYSRRSLDSRISRPEAPITARPTSAFEFRSFGQTNYPLTLGVLPGTEWLLKLLYARPRFEPRRHRSPAGPFHPAADGYARNSAARLWEILPADRRRGTGAWPSGTRPQAHYPRDATIPQLFEDQARRAPHAIAVNV